MVKRERSWCLAYAAVLAGLTTLPYLLGYALQGDTWRFTGFVFGVEDGNSYIAKMLFGAQGEWLFRTPYTSLPQKGVIAFLPYILLGKFAAGPGLHEQLVALFHLFRVLAIPLAVLACYQFISLFVHQEKWRRWATVLATAGGGLGWLFTLFGNSTFFGSLPLDFYSPETFGFLAFYGLPHLILARALMLTGLVKYLQSVETPRRGWMAGLCFLGLALIQPLAVLSSYAVIAGHQVLLLGVALFQRRRQDYCPWFKAALRVSLLSLPLIIYLALAFLNDPFLQAWTDQNRILSPHPAHYIVAYGLLAIPALMGGWRLVQEDYKPALLLIAWVLIFPILAYAPHNLQRRLVEGVWVALVTLAVLGLVCWFGRELQRRDSLIWAILLLAFPSSLLLLAGGFGVALQPHEPVFRPIDEVTAIQWLSGEAEPGSVVLAAYESSNVLPAWMPVRVIIGHGPESANLEALLPQVHSFYSNGMTKREMLTFINDMDVRYVWRGPYERKLGLWDPASADFLTLLYQQGGYEVYCVLNTP